MTALNLTALGNVDSFSGTLCTINNSTEGILIGGFIIAVFFVMLVGLKKWDFDKALLVSSWSCFILSLIMTSTSCPDGSRFLSAYYAIVFLIIAGLTALYEWTAEN